jgi:hypothetical protein
MEEDMKLHEANYDWYIANQDELVKKYNGKHLVLVNRSVVGAYDSDQEAYRVGSALYGVGNYSIQRCSSGDRDTVVYAYSPMLVSPPLDYRGAGIVWPSGEVRMLSDIAPSYLANSSHEIDWTEVWNSQKPSPEYLRGCFPR